MKKLLIYFPERKLKPSGGPAGYLYNLRNGLKDFNYKDSELEIDFYNNGSMTLEENTGLKKKMPKRILELRRALKDTQLLKKKIPVDSTMKEYDMIHFHWTEDMYRNREFLETYTGKVILTSHSPCVYNQERIGKLNPIDYRLLKRPIDRLIEMDEFAFKRADYVVFPCEEAEEPYYHTWNEYASIRKNKKILYLPTGIVGCSARITRAEYRKKYHIPEDAFVVSYVGRHNEIKGYADLKKMGEKLLNNQNTYFLIAGKEEPMKGLDNSHWIEVGWTNDPHSLIAASDVFVLPNHETYFDLVLLEVLSLGVPVVLSNTGGNKYFKKFENSGLSFYDTVEDAIKSINHLKKMNKLDIEKLGKCNREIFDNNFTVEYFTQNYIHVIRQIAEDK